MTLPMDTLNPIRIAIEDPEGKELLTGYAWRVPAVGDSITVPVDRGEDGDLELLQGEVMHRHWYGVNPRGEPSVTITVELT